MRKQKPYRPILLALFALILGTSLVFAIFSNGSNSDLGSLYERNQTNNNEREPGRQIPEETINRPEADATEETEQPEIEAAHTADFAESAETENKQETEEDESGEKEPAVEKAPAEDPVPQPVKNELARVTVNGLNVRPDPSTENDRIDLLLHGQTVEVLAEKKDWLQVKLADGRIGWVSGAYVSRFSPSAGAEGTLAGRVILIDPGHGGTDPGAVGVSGLREKEVVLAVSLLAADKLRAEGAEVVMTRESDVFIPLTQRVSIAETARAEVFVSVHANAHPSPQIGGTETYYCGNKASSNLSMNLANRMQRELAAALGLRDIGAKEASFLVIRQSSMPSVLLELGFLSNAREESLMRTSEFRQKAAAAIVRALRDYFN